MIQSAQLFGHYPDACIVSDFCFLAARKMTTRDYSDTVIAIPGKSQSLGKEAKHGQWKNHVGK